MKVRLQHGWLSPSGEILDRGEHEIDKAWAKALPDSAVVLDEPEPEPEQTEAQKRMAHARAHRKGRSHKE